MDLYCSTDLGIRTCGKYLGTFDILIGVYYCKSCKHKNHYEIITEKGLQKLKSL